MLDLYHVNLVRSGMTWGKIALKENIKRQRKEIDVRPLESAAEYYLFIIIIHLFISFFSARFSSTLRGTQMIVGYQTKNSDVSSMS